MGDEWFIKRIKTGTEKSETRLDQPNLALSTAAPADKLREEAAEDVDEEEESSEPA